MSSQSPHETGTRARRAPGRLRATAQFLALGALLFAAQHALLPRAPARAVPTEQIEISSQRVDGLRREALARWGRLPDADELEALIEQEVADEILYREALALGIDRRDSVVGRRLVRNMRFLTGDEQGDAEALLREARALGMDRSDLVVRRRLIQRMRLALEAGARASAPSDAELAAYLAAHAERFAQPVRVRISQLFFDRERRRDAEAAARARLAGLAGSGPEAAAGDPFLAARDLPLQSPRELAKLFGPEFAEGAAELPVGRWSGPLRSAHGVHLVWVHERVPAALPELDAVRDRVRYALLAERGERAVRDAVARARARYRVRVAGASE